MEDYAQATGGEQTAVGTEGQYGQSGIEIPQGTETHEIAPGQETISPEEAIAQLEVERSRSQMLEQQSQVYQQLVFQQMQNNKIQNNYAPESKALFDELAQLGEGDYVAKEVVQKSLEKVYAGLKSEMQDQIVAITEYQAKMAHPDFDDVVTNYTADIVRNNPDIYTAIMQSRNPSETAYQIGLTHPRYIQDKTTKSTKAVVEKIGQNIKQRPTLATQLGGQASNGLTADAVKNMPSDDFMKLVEQSKRGNGLPFK